MAKLHLFVLRFSSLGDIVVQSSCIAAIKRRWGDSVHLSLLTSQEFAPLMEGTPFIDEVHSFPRTLGVGALLDKVKAIHGKNKIDCFLDLHGTLRSLVIRFYFWKIPRIYGDKRTLERLLLTLGKIDVLSWQYGGQRKKGWGELILERVAKDFAAIFQYPVEGKGLELPSTYPQGQLSFSCGTFQKDSLEKELGLSCPFVVLAPSASFPGKRWPVESFKAFLALALGEKELSPFQFVISAGPKDDFCTQFDDLCERYPHRVVNLQGKLTLKENIFLLKKAHFCLGNDTGIPHLAESVGIPTLVILGPTGEQFGFYPHLSGSDTLSLSLWCRPCSSNGKGTCIRSQRFCLTLITPEMLLAKAKPMILKRGRP